MITFNPSLLCSCKVTNPLAVVPRGGGLSALAGATWRWLHMHGGGRNLIPAASQLTVSPVQGSTNIEGLEQRKRL